MGWKNDAVFDQLLTVYAGSKLEVLECSRILVQQILKDTKRGRFHIYKDDGGLASILRRGHGDEDATIRDLADAVLSELGAAGHLEYRKIWQEPRRS